MHLYRWAVIRQLGRALLNFRIARHSSATQAGRDKPEGDSSGRTGYDQSDWRSLWTAWSWLIKSASIEARSSAAQRTYKLRP